MSDFQYDGKDLEAMSFALGYHRWILSRLRPYLGKRVVEVGAGSGSFTELLLEESLEEIVAVEPSRTECAKLVEHTKGDTRVIPRNDFFSAVSGNYPEHFDSAVYVNVLEHIEDERAELAAVYGALKPGGRVCIFVPALPWLYSEHDASIGHYRRYTKKYLRARLEEAGFEIEKLYYFDIAGVLPWFILIRLLRGKPGAGSVKFYDAIVVPISRVFESIVPLPIGKNLVAIGKKRG